jgi:glycosyltransferase involved in cell wall biosynthesis
MTVLQLISSEGCYGAENMLLTLSGALGRVGHRPIVALFEDGRRAHLEIAEQANRRGLPVEVVHCKGRWDADVPGRIRELMKHYQADVLHTHGYKADVYGYVASWQLASGLVSTCHNWPDRRPIMRAYAALDRIVLRVFDRVAAVSDNVANILGRWHVNAITLPNGIELERFENSEPVLRAEMPAGCDRLVGFVGRLVPGKGGALLLEASRQVLADRPNTAFVFVGDGPCREEWERKATALGIGNRVFFTGARSDIPGVYASLDVMVLPSLEEALPMCVLEAMAAGCPVIATRVGSVPEVVIPDHTGVLIEPGDVSALGSAIADLLANQEKASGLARQGREHVVQRFSAHAMATAYLELYTQALALRATSNN